MAAFTTLLQFLLMLVAGWLQRQQAAAIDYLKAENCNLRARLGGRRIIFTDVSAGSLRRRRGRWDARGYAGLGRSSHPICCFVGIRELVARKWTFIERRRPGRPRTREELVALVGAHGHREPQLGLHANPGCDE